MTKPVATHTVSLTIGALYLLLVLGAPFCVLDHAADLQHGGTGPSASICSGMADLCDSAVLPSDGSGGTVIHPVAGLFVTLDMNVSEFALPGYPGRSPPVFLS